ncbi:MAG: 30S ribosomal protein S20 [Candidatus Woesebacteria bacterium]|nr:30S ribosomal protein S20 [Candidatus Woesebacteria bacterium]
MPVTTTAKRALRGSKKKESVNKIILAKLGVAVRVARKSKTAEKIIKAVSLADRAAKKKVIHRNKAARIKSQLSKLLPKAVKLQSKTSKKK